VSYNDLSFDPNDRWFPVPGSAMRWAVQVFTLSNVYGLGTAARVTTAPDETAVTADELTWGAGRFTAPGRVGVRLRRTADGTWLATIEAAHAEPVKAVKLLLRDLPAQTGTGWWHAGTEVGTAHRPEPYRPVRFDYPSPHGWTTPWVAGGEGPALTLSVRDSQVRGARFFAHTPPWAGGDTIAEVVCDQDARQYGDFTAPPIRLRWGTDVAADFAQHMEHVADTYRLVPWHERPDVPAWARRIRLVLNLHGQHWTGAVFNTYDEMAAALRFTVRHIDGDRVLAFLPGWEGRYYFDYPHFAPAEALGGPAGFGRLADTAAETGVTLLPMFGAHGANTQVYPQWSEAALRNPTDRYVDLLNKPDWDGDRTGEQDQVFLNTGHPGFRALLVDQVSALVDRYGLRAAFFDTTGNWFNDPRYNLYEGYRALAAELSARHPGLLLAGEGWFDALLGVFPVNQSVTGIGRSVRFPQLLTRYGRAVQHMHDGAPGSGSTGVFEAGWRPAETGPPAPGHLPSIGVVADTLAVHAGEFAARIAAARG